MTYPVIIWDFDGTLADTLKIALRVFNELAEAHGFLPIKNTHAVRDMSLSQFLKIHRVRMHQVPGTFTALLGRLRHERQSIRLNEGIAETVHAIRTAGIRQVVVSSNDPITISDCLQRHGVSDCFESVHGTSRLFGKSGTIQQVTASHGLSAGQALYVGDEIRDIEAARAAGSASAAVTWGLNSEAALRTADPTHVIHAPAELCGLL